MTKESELLNNLNEIISIQLKKLSLNGLVNLQ